MLDLQKDFFSQVVTPVVSERLFDHLRNLVFFVKNSQAQYVVVNQTLVDRCGLSDKRELLGHRVDEIFPKELGDSFRRQDEEVLHQGVSIVNRLEMHLYPSQGTGWCITHKVPLHSDKGEVIGLAGVSEDLRTPSDKSSEFEHIAAVVDYIQTHYNEPLKVDVLAGQAGLSNYQFERRIHRIFQLTAGQFIQKTRMDAAVNKLRETDAQIAAIAGDCGYSDQSAFSRQFKQTVGLSPGQFRRLSRDEPRS